MKQNAAQQTDTAPRPIFIIGSGRSGTSVLTWAIGQHPNIIVTPETNWLSALASYLEGFYAVGVAAGAGHLTRFKVDRPSFLQAFGRGVDDFIRTSFEARFPHRRTTPVRLASTGMAWSRSRDDPKRRWVDGTPSNSPYVAVLAQMFPDAKFLNLVRQPDEVVRSWLGISWRAADHSDAAKLVDHIHHSQRIGYLAEAALGGQRVTRVLFADMIAEPEETLRRICRFIGEEYLPQMIEPLTGSKINSSGETTPTIETELQTLRTNKELASMRDWYEKAADPVWQISPSAEARNDLATYSSWRIRLPD